MTENWLPIPGYEGRYCVSDQGNVMSMNFMRTGLPGIMKFGVCRGYLSVELQTGPVKKRFSVHKLVMLAFVGPRPDGLTINHKDGNKANNAPTNLEYVTPSENSKHSFRIGLQSNVGEKHSRHKLTEDEVKTIILRLANGETPQQIVRDYNVNVTNIYHIRSGKRWPHLPRVGKVG